ncbi:hypothetical protein LG943_08005 [Streptomonospora sp. S1-112]|uniref:Uncharacterized protein n=1 Tax=Streptomonospora mangrovi TaxID=2883123 RepID=A0A9X3SD08_9ACTN|nr:hypothetical protein [Streptomonospora mangrovi]MDA0564268.1 hypothetical protein [Streptomonospora mangrovi]
MSYPEPPPGSGDPYQQYPQGDPYAQPGMPSGGYPAGDYSSGAMVPYNQQTGGYQAPYAPVPESEAILTTIGDISITQTTVITPAGRFPIKGSTWNASDMTHTTTGVSTTGIVLTVISLVIFIWACGLGLLGLLFLLMKEEKTQGSVQVTVQGNGVFHSTMVPARSPQTVMQVMQSVNYARSLAATS